MHELKSLWQRAGIRRAVYLLAFAALWQFVHGVVLAGSEKQILFPSVPSILESLVREMGDGSMLGKVGYSLRLIFIGIALSFAFALVLTPLCMVSKTIKDLVKTLISVLDPLPGIALLPIAILWFGLGESAILFVMVHSVLWPMLLNWVTGFDSVPVIYQEVGRSFGLSKLRQVGLIYAPAAFPSILTGIKTGWTRAWRALISAEMVFGVTAGQNAGVGWDLYTKRSYMDYPGYFASLIVIMIIGILIEEILFNTIEHRTLYRWGVVR